MVKTIIENVTVIDIADKGKAIGKSGEKTIFIEGAVPGDVVNVELIKRSKSFDEGRVSEILQYSEKRSVPFCQHFGICGGCKWQHLSYEGQLFYKEKIVRDAMQRIGKIPDAPVLPILGSSNNRYYRNKLEFTFTNKRYLLNEEMNTEGDKQMDGLGFHIPARFNKVLDIKTCYLQDTRSDEIRLFVKNFSVENNMSYFDLKSQTGMLRNLVIRNTSIDEWMVIVVFKDDEPVLRNAMMEAIKINFPFITSLQYIINQKRNDTTFDQQTILYSGKPHIIEQLENLKFIIGPKSFFQTNTMQALNLYRITREFASLSGDEIVYDLYTGTGTIASFVSSMAKKVIGIESVPDAITDAGINAQLNNITNTVFIAGDMKNVFTSDLFKQHGAPSVIITDPPRAGMHEDVVNRILESGAGKVVYVSCNPATQARDLLLMNEKYEVVKMQPVDMFPHTSHVENVALLTLRPN
jgi:23S rRNA (uracil1939-C5)-methyltransferase